MLCSDALYEHHSAITLSSDPRFPLPLCLLAQSYSRRCVCTHIASKQEEGSVSFFNPSLFLLGVLCFPSPFQPKSLFAAQKIQCPVFTASLGCLPGNDALQTSIRTPTELGWRRKRFGCSLLVSQKETEPLNQKGSLDFYRKDMTIIIKVSIPSLPRRVVAIVLFLHF